MKEKLLDIYSKNKKIVWIAGVVLVVILGLIIVAGGKQDKWKDVVLKDYVPEIKKGKLEIVTNETDDMYVHTEGVDNNYYLDYKEKCIEKGYTIDAQDESSEYEAFNKEGYRLRVNIISDMMYVELEAPEKLDNISWPTSELAKLLPTPKSTIGKIESDSSKYFHIKLGETSKDEYNNYVASCEAQGFTVDYDKRDEYYSAKNKDGYKMHVEYLGNNIIDIYIEAPTDEDDSNTESSNTESSSNNNSSSNSSSNNNSSSSNDSNMVDGMRKDFKDAMDSYEAFVDEYVAFMKKYNENPSDLSLLKDLATYSDKLTKFASDFDKWESDDLNAKESAYFVKVQTRVNKKLLEVAN